MNSINRRLTLLALPFIAGFLLFYLIPWLGAIRYSFVESAFDQRFVGLDNYAATLSNRYFRLSVLNTLILIALGVPILVAASLGLALLVERLGNELPVLRAALILPMLLPSSAVANVFSTLPLEEPRVALLALYVWKNAGFMMLIFVAALSVIPREVNEAALLDGAGQARRLLSITLPLIAGAVLFATILAVAYDLRLFREAYLLYGAYPDERVYLTQHYINNHFYKLNYQRLTTASTLFMAALAVLVGCGVRMAGRFSGGRDVM